MDATKGDDQIRMKGLATRFGVSILLLASAIFLGWSVATVSGLAGNNIAGAPMHKVQLTQKGYIQVSSDNDF